MMADEGSIHAEEVTESRESRHHRAGSRTSRLTEAGKQIEIVLEGVDLDAEPVLGEAVTEAVIAVDRAYEIAEEIDGERPETLVRGDDGTRQNGTATRSEGRLERRRAERTLKQLVQEAYAE